jgi:hypothetical protein
MCLAPDISNYDRRVNPIRRFKNWRAAKKADREAIADAAREARRAGDEPPRTVSETVADVADSFPPPS